LAESDPDPDSDPNGGVKRRPDEQTLVPPGAPRAAGARHWRANVPASRRSKALEGERLRETPSAPCAESQPRRGGITLAQGKRSAALSHGVQGMVA